MLERSMARDVVVDQERRFTVALDSAVVPFNIVNPVFDADGRLIDMRFVYINPAGARLMNRPVPELIGRTFAEVLPSFWERQGLLERYATVLATHQAMQFEIPSSANNPGSWFNVIISPVNGSLAIWFEDITQRKQQEKEQAEADRRKDEFLATLAHELRNPLAPIRQGVRVARSESATEAQIRWSHEVIERQVKHMALLLDDLLDVSRISRGTLLLRKANVDLAGVMDAALEVARPHIEASSHHLQVQLPPAKVIVDLDPLRIAQVVGNLLSNAAKYTDAGGHIRLMTAVRGDELVVQVADTGIGMTTEQMRQLFEMFAQAPAAVGRSQGGLGIGLALARNLVRLHGGDIEVQSAGIGYGSEFVVRLPGCIVNVQDSAAVGEPASS
jgi:signal transduction histidine kinase